MLAAVEVVAGVHALLRARRVVAAAGASESIAKGGGVVGAARLRGGAVDTVEQVAGVQANASAAAVMAAVRRRHGLERRNVED